MAFDWLVKTLKRLWGSDDQSHYRDPITPLVRDWPVSEAEARCIVGVYARMAGTDNAAAIGRLLYLSQEEALEQIGEA